MRSLRFLMLPLALAASLSLVSGCASKALVYPPSADLAVEPKPQLGPEDVMSEAALDRHDIAIEARGDRLAAQVGRMCRFWKDLGMKGLDCPVPETRPKPG